MDGIDGKNLTTRKPLAPEAPKEKSVFGSGMSGYVRVPAPEATTKEPDFEKMYRQLLWESHAGRTHSQFLYGDDGEMQCCECGLDFKRSPLVDIDKRLWEVNLKRAVAPGEAVGRETRDVKYRIDPEAETKFMALPGGGEISTEATECEIDLWRELSTLRRERDQRASQVITLIEQRDKLLTGWNAIVEALSAASNSSAIYVVQGLRKKVNELESQVRELTAKLEQQAKQ